MAKIRKIPVNQMHGFNDFNYDPFLDGNDIFKALSGGRGGTDAGVPASGYFSFSGNPADADTITPNGVVYTILNTPTDVAATGNIAFTATTPLDGDTVTVNGVVFTFKDTPVASTDVQTNASRDTAGANLQAKLSASSDARLTVATYAYDAVTNHRVNVTYGSNGADGNAFTLAVSAGGRVTVSGATLTGGRLGVQRGADLAETLGEIESKFNASTDARLTPATYNADIPNSKITVTYDTVGQAGNAFTLAENSTAITVSGATLSGGLDNQDAGVLGWFVEGQELGVPNV